MNILYLGSLTSYVTQNDVAALEALGYNVIVLCSHPTHRNPATGLVELDKIVHLREMPDEGLTSALTGGTLIPVLLTALKRNVSKIKRVIQDNQIDLVFATWGSNMIPLVKAIQDTQLQVPIIYNFLSYPQNVYKWKVLLENWYCRKPIENLSGRIHANEYMYEYFNQNFSLKNGLDIIITPFFSEKYLYRDRLPLLSEKDGEPHVVFIGPIQFPWDDIQQEIQQISKEKIHFHMARQGHSNSSLKENNFIHFFPYFSLKQLNDGSLATFMTQFDVCIVTFNFEHCSSTDRFRTSYPSRFLFALSSGIPIVMPKGHLLACEKFINKYQNGFTYKDIAQLKKMFYDDNFMKKCKRNAITNAKNFTYEKNFHKLDGLLKSAAS